MVSKVKPQDEAVVIKFGGGLHTRASDDEIDPREAADGQNFLLDLENRELRPRSPFDLIGTVPNAAEIRGGGSLLKSDGTVKTFVQAGASVYEWDGATTFTKIATVSATAKLRGHWRSHNFTLDNKVLVTDLQLVEVVKEWNGTTFQSVTFTNQADAAFGTFYAKYLNVSNERAIFFHIRDPGGTFPHLIVGSERSNYDKITVANRPASSLSEGDPFFLVTPDIKPINGAVEAFGTTVISTEKGQLFNLTGSSAKDFAFSDFYPGSAASGAEAMSYIGNDIIYGRPGRIESVRDTDRFGDTEADDLSKPIADEVAAYTGWRIVYNARLNRAYLFPEGVSECRVINTAMLGGELSPWMKWTTAHALAFRPTFVMSMLDPADGLEYVFMGDDAGRFYRLEGTGASGDGGSSDITVEWVTKLFSFPLDAQGYKFEGWIKYRKNVAATVTITMQYAGETAFNESMTVTIPALSGIAHFGGAHYFGGSVYFGALFENRLLRQKIVPPGQANEFQAKISVTGTSTFSINEIGLRNMMASK